MVGTSMIILWNSSRPLFPLTFEECKQDERGTAWETIRESRSYRAGGGKHEWAVGRGPRVAQLPRANRAPRFDVGDRVEGTRRPALGGYRSANADGGHDLAVSAMPLRKLPGQS